MDRRGRVPRLGKGLEQDGVLPTRDAIQGQTGHLPAFGSWARPTSLGKGLPACGDRPHTPATASPQGTMPDRRGDAPSASSPNAGRVPALVEELEAKVDEGKECQDDQGQDHNERDAAHRTMRRFGWHLIWRIR